MSKVYYDRNGATGGSVPKDNTIYKRKDLITVMGNTGALVKKDSEFAYWTTAFNRVVRVRKAGAMFKIGKSDIVFKAQWYPTEEVKEQITSYQVAITLVAFLLVLLSTVALVLLLET